MHEEGYEPPRRARSRARAGVKQALVYYYFPSMDDLFVEVLKAGAEASLERMRKALIDDDPSVRSGRSNSDLGMTALNTEFMALANHRKAIGAQLRAYAERVRDIETAADDDECGPAGSTWRLSAVAIAMLIAQIARSL